MYNGRGNAFVKGSIQQRKAYSSVQRKLLSSMIFICQSILRKFYFHDICSFIHYLLSSMNCKVKNQNLSEISPQVEFPEKGDIPSATLQQIESLLPPREPIEKKPEMEEVMLSDYDASASAHQVKFWVSWKSNT